MQKVLKGFISLGLSVAMCLGITAIVGKTDVVATDAATDYYAGITATGGTSLLGQVHDLITKTHTNYTTYNDCRDKGAETDPALDGKGALEFYTHESIASYIGSTNSPGTWNREHVWPKADSNGLWKSVNTTDKGGGADLHHVRPSEKELNNSRADLLYGEVKNGSPAYSKTTSGANSQVGGYKGLSVYGSGTAFEPLENVKGDVARIVMYVYTHYNTYKNVGGTTNGNGDSLYFGTLKFTHIISASSESEAISLLLEWNKIDPVDEIERTRNEVAFKYQHNRNPFIDHPEYADAIWGNGSITPGEGPSVTPGEDPSVTPGEDPEEAGEFHTAVAGIVTNGTLAERWASINKAITAYQALSEAERSAAEADVKALRAAIEDYNKLVKSYNDEAQKANKAVNGR